jgi:hypothetical protein
MTRSILLKVSPLPKRVPAFRIEPHLFGLHVSPVCPAPVREEEGEPPLPLELAMVLECNRYLGARGPRRLSQTPELPVKAEHSLVRRGVSDFV